MLIEIIYVKHFEQCLAYNTSYMCLTILLVVNHFTGHNILEALRIIYVLIAKECPEVLL